MADEESAIKTALRAESRAIMERMPERHRAAFAKFLEGEEPIGPEFEKALNEDPEVQAVVEAALGQTWRPLQLFGLSLRTEKPKWDRFEAVVAAIRPEHRVAFLDLVLEGKAAPDLLRYLESDRGAMRAADEALEAMSRSFDSVAEALGRPKSWWDRLWAETAARWL